MRKASALPGTAAPCAQAPPAKSRSAASVPTACGCCFSCGAGWNPAADWQSATCAGKQPARRLPICPTIEHFLALMVLVLDRESERIQRTIVRPQINLAGAARQSAAMHEGGDRLPAVPKFLAGGPIQRVDHRGNRTLLPLRRRHLAVLAAQFPAGNGEDDAVDDERSQRRHQ